MSRTATPPPRFFRALPPYLGGKRRLAPLIFALIAEAVPRTAWASCRLLDPFSGGGAVALTAKAQGFHVIAADIAERAVLVSRGLIANSDVRLRPADTLDLFREPPAPYPRVAATYSPRVFTPAQAAWIDRALARAACREEPRRSLLRLLILKVILRSQPMSLLTATDAGAAARGDYDRISPRRLGHYLRAERALEPARVLAMAADVNAGVFGGRGDARRGDAGAILSTTPADVVYLDPPYAGTSRYDREYAVLDQLLGDGDGAPPPLTLDGLLDAARAAPLLVLSYGGPTVTLDDVVALVERHRRVRRALAVPYPHLQSLATEAKNHDNREYLIVAGHD